MSKDYKKIFLSVGVLLMAVVVVLVFGYLPLKRDVVAKRVTLAAMQFKIQALDSLMENDKTIAERVHIFRDRVSSLKAKFPAQEKEALKAITKVAGQLKLVIVSMQSQPAVDVVDDLNQPLEVEGLKCRSVVVAVDMKGSFKNFMIFINQLEDQLPYFTIRRFVIIRDTQMPGQLLINFEMNVYLLS
jgi:hypothetical protein